MCSLHVYTVDLLQRFNHKYVEPYDGFFYDLLLPSRQVKKTVSSSNRRPTCT